jgi:hypothetical protein
LQKFNVFRQPNLRQHERVERKSHTRASRGGKALHSTCFFLPSLQEVVGEKRGKESKRWKGEKELREQHKKIKLCVVGDVILLEAGKYEETFTW